MVALIVVSVLLAGAVLNPSVAEAQKKKYHFYFVNQWGPGVPFAAPVEQGMKDAAAHVGVDATIIYLKAGDSAVEQLAILETVLLKKPDGIITTINHPTVFNKALTKALDMGIPVVAANTHALWGTGHPLDHKIPYIGSSLFVGGYELAKKALEYAPDATKVRALVGVDVPGASWAEDRAGGAIKYFEEKEIPYEKLDGGGTLELMESRMAAYLLKNPDTNLVMYQGGGGPPAMALALRAAGRKPGEVIVAGYDVVPQTAQEIKKGYVTVVNDQQPYLQGYLPVIQLFLRLEYALSGWSVDTGLGYVDKNNIEKVQALIEKRVR